MAKKTSTKRSSSKTSRKAAPSVEVENSTESKNTSGSTRSAHEGMDYAAMFKTFAANPAVRYVAAGMTTALLTRLATKLSERYPEISEFIRTNMDLVEETFGAAPRSAESSDSARH